jgi:glycosyltransferase involved in cell wall biosynthesis
MKVCLLTRYFSLRNGGIGRFSLEMRNGLEKRGYSISPLETRMRGMVGLFLYSAVEIPFKLPRDCDIYHCLTPLEAFHTPKGRSIVTFHDLIPWLHLNKIETHYSRGRMDGFLSGRYFKSAAAAAARCACVSEQTRVEVIEHLGVEESRVSVIPLGIRSDLGPAVKNDATFRIGTLSYLDRRKRIDLLIKAFREANVDGELVIGGTGVDEQRLKALAGADKRIKFLGFVDDGNLVDFYNSLDYFVFPTKIEGYGLPMVEAFACKKPVVVLGDAMIPNEVKSRCIVVDSLTDFLRQARQSADLEGNYRFAKAHNWDACVEKYIDLYKRIAVS